MKVLIVSDTHGRHTGLDRVLEKEGKIDLFIHLGDIEGGESYINSVVECEKHMVRGNNDFINDEPDDVKVYEMEHPDVLLWAVWHIRGRKAEREAI